MDSILTSTKKFLGITEDYTHFDPQIIMHINSVFFMLNQLGVGPDEPYRIEDKSDEWSDFTSATDVEAIRSFVYLRVRLLFDPPTNAALLSAMKEEIREIEWRLNVQVDPGRE